MSMRTPGRLGACRTACATSPSSATTSQRRVAVRPGQAVQPKGALPVCGQAATPPLRGAFAWLSARGRANRTEGGFGALLSQHRRAAFSGSLQCAARGAGVARAALLPSGRTATAAATAASPPPDAALLNNIFNSLPGCPTSGDQRDPVAYLVLFASFLRDAGLRSESVAVISDLATTGRATIGDTAVTCRFFGPYGCVLLTLSSPGCASEPMARLHLLGADNWSFGIRGSQFIATAGGSAELFAGTEHASELSGLLSRFEGLLHEAQKNKGDKRSAARGKQGHQRTPAFILAVLQDALEGLEEPSRAPRGGLTDVGLHTGGATRATSWPLAAAVIRCVMEQLPDVSNAASRAQPGFSGIVADWELWLVELALDSSADGSPPAVSLGAVAHMLDSAACRGAALASGGHDTSALEARAAAAREQVLALQAAQLQRTAALYVLPRLAVSDRGIDGQAHRLPALDLPPPLDARLAASDMEACRARASTNLCWLPLLPAVDTASAAEIDAWLYTDRVAPGDGMQRMAPHLRAAGLERWVFTAAVRVLQHDAPACIADDEELLVAELAALSSAVESYRAGITHALSSAPDGDGGRLLTELHSRETLVTWAAACLGDRMVRSLHPQLGQYEMGLDFTNLRHLSLSDGLAHDALQAVCQYLRKRTSNGAMARPVFSLLSDDATPQLAAHIGGDTPAIRNAWQIEQKHAAGRRDAHWAEVQRKQALARQLRVRLASEEAALASAERAWSAAPAGDNSTYSSYQDKAAYNRRSALYAVVLACQSTVYGTQRELKAAEQAPTPVVQPLPSDSASALAVLFFLYMPPALRSLSRLSFAAQAALLPRPLSVFDEDLDSLQVANYSLDWRSHHNGYQKYQFYNPSPQVPQGGMGEVALKSRFGVPLPDKNGPQHVDACRSPSDGVWHPNGPLHMDWRGMDPWLPLLPGRMRDFYTAALPEAHASLQWALPQEERAHTAAERSNVAAASQAERPEWLSKPQYLAFAGVRSYPLLQLRKVVCALRQHALPLTHEATRLLLRQALYQAGTLDGSGPLNTPTVLTWKTDLASGELLDALHHELARLADELKVCDHAALLTVLDAAAYARIYESPSPRFAAVRARCVAAVRNGIAALEAQVASCADPDAVAGLRAKQCVFSMYGVIAHGGNDALTPDELRELAAFIVEAHSGYVFQADSAEPDAFTALRQRCECVMAERAPDVMAAARRDSTILTAAVRGVHARTPATLSWTELTALTGGVPSGCFEAVTRAPEVHLYSLNLLTGLFLLDGSPPRSLPADVLAHPLYVRTFGARDFEVSVTASGSLRTVRALAGQFYDFYLEQHEEVARLRVTEIAVTASGASLAAPLELLNGTRVTEWGAELPVRLQQLHSHWLCRASGTLFIRDVQLPARNVSFVALLQGGTNAVRCVRVPRHMRALAAAELASLAASGERQLADALVLWQAPPVPALLKFEALPFVHWYLSATTGRYSVELPRFGLEFELLPGGGAGGRLQSKNYANYALALGQQLDDTLPGFSQYLVLEPEASLLTQHPWGGPVKVVTPSGGVGIAGTGGDSSVRISGDDAPGAHRASWTFDVHERFGELRAQSIPARLQLAALYAASCSGVPEPRAGMTGGEAAMELVRRCFINRPPTGEEQALCDNVAALSRVTPALHLLCHHWSASARQLAFLHPGSGPLPPQRDDALPDRLADSAMEYMSYAAVGACNARRMLTPEEELRVLGKRSGPSDAAMAPRLAPTAEPIVQLGAPPVKASYVVKAEARLRALVVVTPVAPQPFPLEDALGRHVGDLGGEMLAELRASWEAKQGLPHEALHADVAAPRKLKTRLAKELTQASKYRKAAEKYLLKAAAATVAAPAPGSVLALHKAACGMQRAAGRLPPPTLQELARTLWMPAGVEAFNPLLALSGEDRRLLRKGVFVWLQLAVLEDKLTRLTRMAAAMASQADDASSTAADIIKELLVTRTWDASAHPEWLAFEADGALQIRPAQHAVVRAVLETPGAIVQLNMGEGKTRVIVPMLVLHWARAGELVRLHFLSQLLPEAYDHLHTHLTGGMLGTKLFLMPFHRDVEVTPGRADALLAHAAFCRRTGGAVLVTPEARGSLHLKQHELRRASRADECDQLARLEALPWHDVYDESDEMMRVKFQLIYAVGSPLQLPALAERCAVLSSLLRALRDDPAARAILADDRVAVCTPEAPGAFLSELRLLPGAPLDAALPALHVALAKAVLTQPPHELRWLTRFGRAPEVLAYVTDALRAADEVLPPSVFASERHRDALLTMRGLLAQGVLAHALRLRHRVEYGVAPPGPGRRKRLAIPFRACDMPAERSEFAHPDATLALTKLSYYHGGLSDAEVAQAFTALLSLGDTEQEVRYAEWHAASAPALAADEAASIDAVRKLDLTDVLQAALLCRAFRASTCVIDFWLLSCVLPAETQQYPHRLKATAWHMRGPAAGVAIGFSGTNDQHRLLPLPDPGLAATNGHMLSLLLAKAAYTPLFDDAADDGGSAAPPAPAWQQLLAFAVRHGAVALIDAGALLAGVELGAAAAHLLQLLRASSDLQAVVFFDSASGHGGEWVVVDHAGRRWPKKRSPIRERDAFVLFDEARCRGADMRLRRDALAVLTLGPRMSKDKLMQAAGRLRQLASGQRLLLTAQRDIHDSIVAASFGGGATGFDRAVQQASVEGALRWVLRNTIAASRAGLLEWSMNGLHYASTHGAPQRVLLDERLELAAFYAPASHAQEIGVTVSALAAHAAPDKAAPEPKLMRDGHQAPRVALRRGRQDCGLVHGRGVRARDGAGGGAGAGEGGGGAADGATPRNGLGAGARRGGRPAGGAARRAGRHAPRGRRQTPPGAAGAGDHRVAAAWPRARRVGHPQFPAHAARGGGRQPEPVPAPRGCVRGAC